MKPIMCIFCVAYFFYSIFAWMPVALLFQCRGTFVTKALFSKIFKKSRLLGKILIIIISPLTLIPDFFGIIASYIIIGGYALLIFMFDKNIKFKNCYKEAFNRMHYDLD